MKFVVCCQVPLFFTLLATTLLPMIIKLWGLGLCSWYFVSISLSSGGFACMSHLKGFLSNIRHKATLLLLEIQIKIVEVILSSLFRIPFWLQSIVKTVRQDLSLKLLHPSPHFLLLFLSFLPEIQPLKPYMTLLKYPAQFSVFASTFKWNIKVLKNKTKINIVLSYFLIYSKVRWLHFFTWGRSS